MTREQEEAIEYLEQFIGKEKEYKHKPIKIKTLPNTRNAIETVLNMIKEKDKEIDCLKKAGKATEDIYKREIEKKNKIIDLLIDYVDKLSEYYTRIEGKNNEFCNEKCIDKNIECYDCIKQYFERKSEE